MQSIGWDVGGAHLKAAHLNQAGEVLAVYQAPCPLWQGLIVLEQAVEAILAKLPKQPKQHALTMTGELVDLFSDRATGVREIIALMQRLLPAQILLIYAGRAGFLSSDAIKPEQIEDIASANWLASASYAAQQVSQAVFVDIGSTTTDILLLDKGNVAALGYTDFQRLRTNELVYSGLVRTAVMAVAQSVMFAGTRTGIMSEYFATMADVYRLTNELNKKHDQSETADGAEKTVPASARRLARMVGCNIHEFTMTQWQQLAFSLREQQLSRIQDACAQHLSRLSDKQGTVLVGAGIGRFLVQDIAVRLQLDYVDFNHLSIVHKGQMDMQPADCAPAVAVAFLAIERKVFIVT